MEIIKAIVENNILRVKELITAQNVNYVLDKRSNYIALHYAVEFKRNEILCYLFSLGASIYAKTSSGEISFDLALKNQYVYFFILIDKARIYSLHLNIKYEKEIVNLKNTIETTMDSLSNLNHISNNFKYVKVPEGLPCKIHGFNCPNINIQQCVQAPIQQRVQQGFQQGVQPPIQQRFQQGIQPPVQPPVQKSSQNMILQRFPEINLVSLPMKNPLQSNNGITSNEQNQLLEEQSSPENSNNIKQPPKQSSFTALDRLIYQLSNDISYIQQDKSSSSSSYIPTVVHSPKRGRKSKKEENEQNHVVNSFHENNKDNKRSKNK